MLNNIEETEAWRQEEGRKSKKEPFSGRQHRIANYLKGSSSCGAAPNIAPLLSLSLTIRRLR